MRLRLRRPKTARRWHKQIIRHVCGENATITGMPGPMPFIRSKPTDDDVRILLALYAAERSDSAYLTQAGRAIIAALLVYVGSVAALGQQFQDAPLLTLIVPLPALGLLIVFVVNSFNQALRDVSSRSLETLLHGATSDYLPNWTIDMLAKSAQGLEEGMPTPLPDEAKALDPKHFRDSSAPLREIVIGLTATDHFYNRHRANKHHKWFLRIYSVLTGFLVVTGMVLVLCYGLHQVIWGHNATTWHWEQWMIMCLEVAVFMALVVMLFWAVFAGIRHRKRAEIAAKILLEPLPVGSRPAQ